MRIGGLAALSLSLLGLGASAALAGGGGVGSGGVSGEEPLPPPVASGEGVFPIVGKHTYGDGLGAGRDHQGQDLLARCGRPVVSAQPGRVQVNRFHKAAGNYLVIDGRGALIDLVYAHLGARSPLRPGQRVEAGVEIGRVGDTGNASTCHLHFETWSNPGYYEGGEPIDPEPLLRSWDQAKRPARG